METFVFPLDRSVEEGLYINAKNEPVFFCTKTVRAQYDEAMTLMI